MFKQIIPVFSLLFYLFLCAKSANICFAKKILNSECICESTLLPEHLDLDSASKLTCHSGNVLQAAIKAMNSRKDLTFLELLISDGTLESLQYQDLKNFQSLEVFSLLNNKILSIERDAFKNQEQLMTLDLSFNHLSSLQEFTFQHLHNLKNLTLSNNHLQNIDPRSFYDLQDLADLDLSNNNISSIDSWLSPLKNLQHLFLNHNKINFIANSSLSAMIHLKKLDLSFNNLKAIPNLIFYRLKNINFVSLAMNELETLDENTFKGNNLLEKVNLTGNLWICDKRLLPLNDWFKKYEAYKEGAMCHQPPDLHNYTIQHALEILYLELRVQEIPICNATMCNCTICKDKLIVSVDCSNRGFVRLPEAVPYKTKVLNLTNNNIRSLNIDHIDVSLWSDVSFLYLNNNIIDSSKGLEGNWLLRNLVALHLSNNRLTEVPLHILEQIRGGLLDELYLSGNPWTCDCNTVRFQTWLQDNYRVVRNFDGIACATDGSVYSGLPIIKLKKSQLCPQQIQYVNYLDVLNGLMAVSILLILFKLIYDYWLQKRTGKLPRFFSLNL